MKKVLSFLVVFLLGGLGLSAQNLPYAPPGGGFILNGSIWQPITSGLTGSPSLTYAPPVGLYGLGTDNLWHPCTPTSPCTTSGGGGGSVSITDSTNSLTITPSPLTGTGTIKLNLGNSNVWTGAQSFSDNGGTPNVVKNYNDATEGEGQYFYVGATQVGATVDNALSGNYELFDSTGTFDFCNLVDCSGAEIELSYNSTYNLWRFYSPGGAPLALGSGNSVDINGNYVGGSFTGVTSGLTSVDGGPNTTSLSDSAHVNLAIGTPSSHKIVLETSSGAVETPTGSGGTGVATEYIYDEGTIGSIVPVSGKEIFYPDSTAHCLEYSSNGGAFACLGTGGGGAVSSVANSDSTLIISPTTGSVVASLNVAHANTWSALQTFSSGVASSGSTQGTDFLGVGTGTVPTSGAPTNFAGWIGPSSGTPNYFASLPNVNPAAAGYMILGPVASVNGVNQAAVTTVPYVADTTTTPPTTAVGAASGGVDTCSASATTITMTGLTTSMTVTFTPTTDTSGSSGWDAGLYIRPWVSAANTVSYKVCNPTSGSLTPASITLNVSAR